MSVRRAFICEKCVPPLRVFLKEGERVPPCPEHGKLLRQVNIPYRAPKVR